MFSKNHTAQLIADEVLEIARHQDNDDMGGSYNERCRLEAGQELEALIRQLARQEIHAIKELDKNV